ncbi:MAG: DUF262 domain-containing HNH endonuclease family protein [Ruminococcus sp.]|nr:DUF262 domain-containing HNH endonuclease family protein [Ruminococcus sp.]
MAINYPITEKKLIKDIVEFSFYIPSYQRGYRWTDQEVSDLLDDIYEFNTGSSEKPQYYCLQPLIVKKRTDGAYEVVDGQQRLTTILIFLKIAQKLTDYEGYKITFETRRQSQDFLDSLKDYDGSIKKNNIDYYHITKAYARINTWLDQKAQKNTPRFSVLSDLFNKITNNVFFIWYELPPDVNSVEIFTRVNVGKISLSNAELIKALIFNKENFPDNAEREQQELSLSWNRIERELQKESFWMFLNENEKKEFETRIDLIFDLLSEKYNKKLSDDYKINLSVQNNRTFLIFYANYKKADSKSDFVKTLWKEVEEIYERFQEWYSDLNKYHIIGYLIASGVTIKEIFKLTDGKKKSEMVNGLIAKTKEKINLNSMNDLNNLSYDYKGILRNVFLLFNIATLVCKNEKQYRFPFDIYKKEKWDIEHIHATADSTDDPDDNIGNLTLLSAEINRSYQNAPFSEKRTVIIERDSKDMFIPICTKNIFLKQYTKNLKQMDIWDKNDKDGYKSEMWNTLETFWKGGFAK